MRWLREHSHAHLHTDLIFGLPGESLESLGKGFDRLVGLRPHEIQVGILKRLRGAPLCRLSEDRGLVFSPYPPYSILESDRLDFATMQRLKRFARYWDLIGNSGRFRVTLPLLLGHRPFARFLAVSDWLHAETGQPHRIALERLFRLLERALCEVLALPRAAVAEGLDREI